MQPTSLEPSSLSSVTSTFTEVGLKLNWQHIEGNAEAIVIEKTLKYTATVCIFKCMQKCKCFVILQCKYQNFPTSSNKNFYIYFLVSPTWLTFRLN